MSWIDKIQDKLIIVTGDGKSYSPSWLNASKQVEYNIAEFEFPKLAGTLVKRGTPLGRKYALELYFQGDDHLDEALAFEISANDPRPWTLQHPFYDTITVQPTALFFDNTAYNVSKITGIVIETITENNPITKIDPIDAIPIAKNTLDGYFENSMTAIPNSTDVNNLSIANRRNYNVGIVAIKSTKEFEEYNNAFNVANSAVNNAIATPLLAMRMTIAFITKPALFATDLQTRINLLTQQFQNLRANITGLVNVSSKQIYQNTAGSVIASMALSTSVNLDPTMSAVAVFLIMDTIASNFKTFLSDLDSIQSTNGGNTTNYIPDAQSLIALNDLINLTISSLFTIALNSKQERSIIVERDTNIILLAHRFYGLDVNDANIEELLAENNLGLNGILQIRKNTKILYYI